MVKVSIISVLLAASAMNASAFAPAKVTFSHKSTHLEAKNGDSIENVGKMFAVAALSLSMFMGPSPAFADGAYYNYYEILYERFFLVLSLARSIDRSMLAGWLAD